MTSLFTKIIQGEIPCHKLLENNDYFSFLDVRPVKAGHALVIPKQETDYIFDLSDTLLGGIMPFAKQVAVALKQAIPCKRIGIMVVGLEVPHAHIHLIPMDAIADLNFANAKEADPKMLAETAEHIRSFL